MFSYRKQPSYVRC